MEIRQLEYFRTIAHYKNLTRAAGALHLTQPALSRILKRLEDDLGFALFVRRSSSLELTEAGEVFLKAVNSALGALDDGLRDCRRLISGGSRQLYISVAYEGLVHASTEQFLRQHPDLSIHQTLLPPDTARERLLARKLDLAIAPELLQSSEINWTRLITEELLLIFPSGHPYEGRKSIELEEFQNLSLAFNEAVYDRTSYNRVCKEYSLRPNILFQSNEHQMISSFMNISETACSLFVPVGAFAAMMRAKTPDEISVRPLPTRISPPVFSRTYGIASLRGVPLSPAAEEYVGFITDYFARLEREISELLEKTFSAE